MINLYWPVYENLEHSFNELTQNVHFNDDQKSVYSSSIIDLILRASSEIESISKELYVIHGGTEKEYLKFDEDCLRYLNSKLRLDMREVYVSHPNCFFTEKTIVPFEKNVPRSEGSGKQTYGWNLAYQNLKHNRVKALEYGSVNNLTDIFAALFLLNIYYKDEVFDVDNSVRPKNFDRKMGSRIFSINLSVSAGDLYDGIFPKNDDFEKSVYVVKMKNESFSLFVSDQREFEQIIIQKITNDIRFQAALQTLKIDSKEINAKFWDIIKEGKIDVREFLDHSLSKDNSKYLEYEAVLNKNQFEDPIYPDKYRSIFGFQGIGTQYTNREQIAEARKKQITLAN